MSDAPETPDSIPATVADAIDRQDVETLQDIAAYADALAEYRATVKDDLIDAVEDDAASLDEQDDEIPDDVPSKATLVQKEINENRYWYYQWREDDSVKSQYKGPVDPDS